MHQLADEIRETFEERGWAIGKAVGLDPAFTKTRRSGSSLGRDLVIDAVEAASSRLGLGYKTCSGGGSDVVLYVDGVVRLFRIRKAGIDPETGNYDVLRGSDSILTVDDPDGDPLIPAERWVLGYTVDDEGLVADIFAARVLGATDEKVPSLILGATTLLGHSGPTTPPPSGRFEPDDEDDLGDDFGDNDVDSGEAGAV